ncbi:Ig-like domain-containing protein [Aromatoleum toluolicum]|uniref:Uncharacterized protein n=1 Tax=Aromatoleum toluolicum TaxID=90060 RepID=A0ABX1NLZ7_9RHOO|nr:Ig-like domain-containing protein [Aromatoleum toluolicum]NMG00388.1 Ig-like domain-containing protein [Aromatoleum toluolicum]
MSLHSTRSPTPSLALKPLVRTLALLCALGAPALVSAQVAPIPFESEGIVKGIYNRPDGTGVELTVFGRTFLVPPGATIHTPTKTLTAAELVDPSRFPGLYRDGFVGSTAILLGEVTLSPDATTATPVIKDVAIEPAETVLLGTLTKNDAGVMSVLDIPLLPSTDPRLLSKGYKNEFGFAVEPASIPIGTFAAVEGYFGDDGNFYHFSLEAGGGLLVDPGTGKTSITRTACVPGARLDVQGATYLPSASVVEFRNPKSNYLYGSMSTTVDLEAPEFGTYGYRVDVSGGEVDSDGACPSQIRVVNLTNGTEAIATVDGVTAPAAPPTTAPENVAPVATADAATVFVGLATEVHLTLNDTDANGNMDPTTLQLVGVPTGLAVQNLLNGDLQVTADAAGTYSFGYTVADTGGLTSNQATVTITAQPVAVDVVDLVRANFRIDKSRWEMRGTTNQAGAQVTAVHVRTGATIATVTSDVTGAWQIDVRNSPILAVAGDIVRVTSSGGGTDQEVVNIVQ